MRRISSLRCQQSIPAMSEIITEATAMGNRCIGSTSGFLHICLCPKTGYFQTVLNAVYNLRSAKKDELFFNSSSFFKTGNVIFSRATFVCCSFFPIQRCGSSRLSPPVEILLSASFFLQRKNLSLRCRILHCG